MLDTNHCSQIIRGDAALIAQVTEVGRDAVCTSTVTAGELILMAAHSERKAENLPVVRRFLSGLMVLPIDRPVADVYGELKADLLAHYGPRSGKKPRRVRVEDIGFSDNDLWIAAVALSNNLILVSRDGDFQRVLPVRGLRVENWYE